MGPHLIAIDGPAKGTACRLEGGELLIGRDPGSMLCLDDPSVSRRHCMIRSSAGGWTISDLETRNGTFVNGLPVKERLLENCDVIRIGSSAFVFMTGDERLAAPPARPQDDAHLATRTIALTPRESFYLDPARLESVLAVGARHSRELCALLEISTSLASSGDQAAIARQLIRSVLEIVPASRAAVVLAAADPGEAGQAYAWSRGMKRASPPAITAQEWRRAAQERSGRLSELDNGRLSRVLAPLVAPGGLVGVLCAEADGPPPPFDSGHLEWLTAVACIAAGAFESARRIEWLETENRRLQSEINLQYNMVGESPGMREVFRQISRIAPADSTVLVRGETGTGKELVARAIHAASRRSARPFVAINCATLSETLLESELFGHERGAFTGAVAQKRGKIEVAEGGTLFLDEIGELAPSLQAKLLRVLQEREFERVGGTRPIRADIRLIAATNRDLEEAANSGAFRRDLYYRIHVIAITVPPLRERREDINLLASYFLARFAQKAPRQIRGISPAARKALIAYDWPGNVRELENCIERAVVLGASDLIMPEDLPETVLEREPPEGGGSRFHEAVREAKRRLILAALEEARGSQQEAAARLGLNPTYLSRLIRNLNIRAAARGGAGL